MVGSAQRTIPPWLFSGAESQIQRPAAVLFHVGGPGFAGEVWHLETQKVGLGTIQFSKLGGFLGFMPFHAFFFVKSIQSSINFLFLGSFFVATHVFFDTDFLKTWTCEDQFFT